jgi:3-methyladenine DNA glycosylase AlkD
LSIAAESFRGFVREVEARLVDAARGISAHDAERARAYHGSTVPHLGLPVPPQRAALRRRYRFSRLPVEAQLPIWDAVWREGRHYETKCQALYYCGALRKPEDLSRAWPMVRRWIDLVDSWDSSDELSAIYSRILEVIPEKVYPVLARWSGSTNAWKRRQSLVSLFYYSRSRRMVLPAAKVFALIERLIDDKDRFVQKAIGWTLREALGPYPGETAKLIEQYSARLSAIAFAEASRKLPASLRAHLGSLRAAARNTGAVEEITRPGHAGA